MESDLLETMSFFFFSEQDTGTGLGKKITALAVFTDRLKGKKGLRLFSRHVSLNCPFFLKVCYSSPDLLMMNHIHKVF